MQSIEEQARVARELIVEILDGVYPKDITSWDVMKVRRFKEALLEAVKTLKSFDKGDADERALIRAHRELVAFY